MNNKKLYFFFIAKLYVLCALLSFTHTAHAISLELPKAPIFNHLVQESDDEENETTAEKIKKLSKIIAQHQKSINTQSGSSNNVEKIIREVNELQTTALALEQTIRPKLQATQEILNDLGPAPKEGEAHENKEVSAKREALLIEKRKYSGYMKSLKVIKTRSKLLIAEFNTIRRDKIFATATDRSYSIFSLTLWSGFAQGVGDYAKSIGPYLSKSFKEIATNTQEKLDVLITILVLVVLLVGLNIFKKFLLKYPIDHRAKTSIIALYNIFKFAVTPIVLIGLLLSLFRTSGVSNSVETKNIEMLFYAISTTLSIFVFSYIFFNPYNTQQRILQIRSKQARRISILIAIGTMVFFIHEIIDNSILIYSFPVEVELSFVAMFSLATALVISSILYMITKDHRDQGLTIESKQALLSWRIFRPVLWAVAFIIFISLALGYIRLAGFLADYIFTMSSGVALYWLSIEILDSALLPLFHTDSPLTKTISNFFGTKTNHVRQVGVVLIGFIKIIIFIIFFAILLAPLGLQTADWFIWTKQAFFGFTIGDIIIKPANILFVIIITIMGFAATRAIQRWLGEQYLPTTDLDHGVQNSINTIFGYIGIVSVSLFAASYAGLNFQNLAIIFGALSVGIGFGLRDIIGNFVSGLILLAERPVKVGDWIITSGGQGTVRSISVRSTQIETFDRATIIVPNQTLITESVTNRTFKNELGRVNIAVRADYGADPEAVRDLLRKCADEHESVLRYPEAYVVFLNMGVEALEFELRIYIKDVGDCLTVASDLRFAILKAMREANIKIPLPQRHVHIEGLEELVNKNN